MAIPPKETSRAALRALLRLTNNPDDVRWVTVGTLLKDLKIKSPRRRVNESTTETWKRLAKSTEEEPVSAAIFPGTSEERLDPSLVNKLNEEFAPPAKPANKVETQEDLHPSQLGKKRYEIDLGEQGPWFSEVEETMYPPEFMRRLGLIPSKQLQSYSGKSARDFREDVLGSQALMDDPDDSRVIMQLDEPLEINNGWLVDGNKRLAIIRSEYGDGAVVPVRQSPTAFNPKSEDLLSAGIVPTNQEEILFANYLSTGLAPYSSDEVVELLGQGGYGRFMRWSDDNDQFWGEFKQAWGRGREQRVANRKRNVPELEEDGLTYKPGKGRRVQASLFDDPVPQVQTKARKIERAESAKRKQLKRAKADPTAVYAETRQQTTGNRAMVRNVRDEIKREIEAGEIQGATYRSILRLFKTLGYVDDDSVDIASKLAYAKQNVRDTALENIAAGMNPADAVEGLL